MVGVFPKVINVPLAIPFSSIRSMHDLEVLPWVYMSSNNNTFLLVMLSEHEMLSRCCSRGLEPAM